MNSLDMWDPNIVIFPIKLDLVKMGVLPSLSDIIETETRTRKEILIDVYDDFSHLLDKYILNRQYKELYNEYIDLPWAMDEVEEKDFIESVGSIYELLDENFEINKFQSLERYRIIVVSPITFILVKKTIANKLIWINGLI